MSKSKQTVYQLNAQERAVALALLQKRPEVIPGTRVCVSRVDQVAWFNEVTAAMHALDLAKSKISAFCDLAGVPD